MVTLKNVIATISSILKTNFPNIDIPSTDIKEGSKRPYFYVELDDFKSKLLNKWNKECKISIRIYYFSKDEYKNQVELLEMQEALNDLFISGIWIENTPFFIHQLEDGLDFMVTDGVLQLQFYLYYVQTIEEDDTSELMEDLDINTIISE